MVLQDLQEIIKFAIKFPSHVSPDITEEGKKRFTAKQYKDKEQIENYWSHRTAQIKFKRSKESKVSDEDVQLVEEDVVLNDRKKLRLQVLESCEQSEKELPDFHPLAMA